MNHSIFFLFGLEGVVFRGQLQSVRNAVNLAIVAIELVELDGLGPVRVDEIEDRLYLLMAKGRIQPLHYLLELV